MIYREMMRRHHCGFIEEIVRYFHLYPNVIMVLHLYYHQLIDPAFHYCSLINRWRSNELYYGCYIASKYGTNQLFAYLFSGIFVGCKVIRKLGVAGSCSLFSKFWYYLRRCHASCLEYYAVVDSGFLDRRNQGAS